MEQTIHRGIELLERFPPGPHLVEAYGRMAPARSLQGRRPEEAIAWFEKAIALGERLGLAREPLVPRQWRGLMRCDLGGLGGLGDIERALQDALEMVAPRRRTSTSQRWSGARARPVAGSRSSIRGSHVLVAVGPGRSGRRPSRAGSSTTSVNGASWR